MTNSIFDLFFLGPLIYLIMLSTPPVYRVKRTLTGWVQMSTTGPRKVRVFTEPNLPFNVPVGFVDLWVEKLLLIAKPYK